MFCGAVQADAISSDVVGYQGKTLGQGFSVLSGTFLGVSANDTLNIQDLVLSGENVTPGTDNIQLLNEEGVSSVTYNWTDADNSPVWVEEPVGSDNWVGVPGWINEAGDDLLDWDMPASQGFVIYSANGGTTLTVAGKVKTTTKTFTTEGGFQVLGNFNPTTLNIQKITLTGDAVTAGTDNIQLLNDEGVSSVTYNWTDADNSPVWVEEPAGSDNWVGIPGWINEAGDDLLDWDMPAGQGFVLYTANAGVTVTIPSYNNVTAE